jgi:hypothetical protein
MKSSVSKYVVNDVEKKVPINCEEMQYQSEENDNVVTSDYDENEQSRYPEPDP